VPFSQIIEIAKVALEILLAVLGFVFLRRLEQIKLEVARRSDFSQKWADLFFDASNAFMVSVEHIKTYALLITGSNDRNDAKGMNWQQEINAALEVLIENRYRIQRLAVLAPSRGSAAEKAVDDLFSRIQEFTVTKKANLDDIRGKIDTFNRAVREAHSEMIASRADSK
jgi:hypothetical protein